MQLKEKIFNIISETLGVEKDKISLNADFFSDFNADKLEVIDLILKVQQIFKIEIPEENFEAVKTVNDLVNLVKENSDEF